MVFPPHFSLSLSPNLLALCFYHVFCSCVCSMYCVVVLSFVMADIVKQFEVSFYQFSSSAFAFLTGQWHYNVYNFLVLSDVTCECQNHSLDMGGWLDAAFSKKLLHPRLGGTICATSARWSWCWYLAWCHSAGGSRSITRLIYWSVADVDRQFDFGYSGDQLGSNLHASAWEHRGLTVSGHGTSHVTSPNL